VVTRKKGGVEGLVSNQRARPCVVGKGGGNSLWLIRGDYRGKRAPFLALRKKERPHIFDQVPALQVGDGSRAVCKGGGRRGSTAALCDQNWRAQK